MMRVVVSKNTCQLFLKSKLDVSLEAKNKLFPGKVGLAAKPFASLKGLLMIDTNDSMFFEQVTDGLSHVRLGSAGCRQ